MMDIDSAIKELLAVLPGVNVDSLNEYAINKFKSSAREILEKLVYDSDKTSCPECGEGVDRISTPIEDWTACVSCDKLLHTCCSIIDRIFVDQLEKHMRDWNSDKDTKEYIRGLFAAFVKANDGIVDGTTVGLCSKCMDKMDNN